MMSKKKAIINTDGASRGNPGPSAIGITIKDENRELLASISKGIGKTTNNQAEYSAVITALEKAIALGVSGVELRSDSELLVRQINGRYRVKSVALKPLYARVVELRNRFEHFTVKHIPREQNKEADALANAALDR